MTAHRLRLFYSIAGSSDFHAWLDTWLTTMQPWDSGEVTNDLPTEVTPTDGVTHYEGELAFDWAEDRLIILDSLDQNCGADCDWHRILYHDCRHDDAVRELCQWDEQRESGAVPASIRDL